MPSHPLGLAVLVAGAAQRSSSTLATVGGYIIVVESAVPDVGATLASVYLGPIGGDTGGSHLRLAPGRGPELLYRVLAGQDPGNLRSCALDHVAELQGLLVEITGATVTIDIAPGALDLEWRA